MNFKIPGDAGEHGELVRHFRRTGLEKGYGPADGRIGTVTNCGAVLSRVRQDNDLSVKELTKLINHYWCTVGKTQIKTRHICYFGFKAATLVADMRKRGLVRAPDRSEDALSTEVTKSPREEWI
ncbi:hypothetical protein ACIA8H_12810 [Streptomyces goshikiensis]|uniref:hypothetical protein n=1 Tax=Streptomyces goshikiensis TaxID=1942 RepID=UPI00378777BF